MRHQVSVIAASGFTLRWRPLDPHSAIDRRSRKSIIGDEEDVRIRKFGIAVAVCGTLAIIIATLTPSSQQESPHSLCLVCGELGGVDIVLNVLLYMPVGAGLAIAGMRYRNGLIAMSIGSALIELLQWTLIPGRDGSVGDVVTNSIGALIGLCAGGHVEALLRPSPREARFLVRAWLAFWIAVQATAAYAMQPSPTLQPYYGQLARALGDEQGYPGRILAATLNGAPLPDHDIGHSHETYESLSHRDGAQLDVMMESPRAPTRRPSVVRIADDHEEEILAVAAEDRDLVYDVRTKASDLRLRGPLFRLDTILPPDRDRSSGSAGVPIHLQARYALPAITLSATRDGKAIQRRFLPGPGDAWRLIALAYHSYDGTQEERVAAAAWLMLLMLPAGYWTIAYHQARVRKEGHLMSHPVSALCIALPVGLGIVPSLFHMAMATWWELAGAVAGMAAGALAGVLVLRTRAWKGIRAGTIEKGAPPCA